MAKIVKVQSGVLKYPKPQHICNATSQWGHLIKSWSWSKGVRKNSKAFDCDICTKWTHLACQHQISMEEYNNAMKAKGNQIAASDLYPSHTEGKTGCLPLMTAKFLVVLGSLVTIANDRVMVLLTFGLVFVDL